MTAPRRWNCASGVILLMSISEPWDLRPVGSRPPVVGVCPDISHREVPHLASGAINAFHELPTVVISDHVLGLADPGRRHIRSGPGQAPEVKAEARAAGPASAQFCTGQ